MQSVVNIASVGEYDAPLNWEIPVGNGLQLIKKGGKDLYGNTSGVTYPFSQPGMATITGNTAGTDASFYFYDWQMEIPEVCERTQIIVPVSGPGSSPGASFSLSSDSLDLTDNQPVQFTNTSTGSVASYDWNFGDGTSSSSESPSHTYSETGTYIVSLTITSSDGCSAFALDTIQVTNNGLSGAGPGRPLAENVAVYPNPASQSVSIQLDLHSAKMVALQLSDMTGKTVRTATQLASQKAVLQLDIADLCTGVYFLSVKMEGGSSVWKVVKI
jgi:PKD repeat protein